MRRKLGLFTSESEDEALVQSLLDAMQENEADFTLTFRRLCDAALDPGLDGSMRSLFKDSDAYDNWAKGWRKRLSREVKAPDERADLMRQTNPAVIPRNHRVEQIIEAAMEREDYNSFEKLLEVLSSPYMVTKEHKEYMLPPKSEEKVIQTFCGT